MAMGTELMIDTIPNRFSYALFGCDPYEVPVFNVTYQRYLKLSEYLEIENRRQLRKFADVT